MKRPMSAGAIAWHRCLAAAVLMLPLSASCAQGAPSDATLDEFAAGHGAWSIDYQHLFMNGDWWDTGPKRPMGSVIVDSMTFRLDYFVAERWDVDVSLPFVSARYSGAFPHPIETLQVPHPDTVFVDDGNVHGTWADWKAALRYHANIGGYYVTPSLTVYVPSHDYTFYGSATAGQDLKKLGLGIELAHQFELTRWYYDAHYEYVFAEQTLGINVDYYAFGFEVGRFLGAALQLRGFVDAKLGNGWTDTQIGAHCPPCSDEVWFLHDKFRLEDHINVGAALDWEFGEHYTFSTAVQRMVWGKSNLNLKYGVDFRLSRSF